MKIALASSIDFPKGWTMETNVRQGHAAQILRDLVSKAHETARPSSDRSAITSIAGPYAWALYHDIEVSTGKPPVNAEMEMRRATPDDPEYFDDLSAIDEFLETIGAIGTAQDKAS
jgi:hypothetical protein